MNPLLSIIVCTYDRYPVTTRAVEHLLAIGGFDPGRHELLVVDNTPAAVRRPFRFSSDAVRIEMCDTVGLSHARNFGIGRTGAPIVAFLDDDAFVAPHWCRSVVERFDADPSLQVVGGKVVPRHECEILPAWYSDDLAGYLSCIDWGPIPRYLRPGEWIVGANMMYRRGVFEKYGRFNTTLGRKGTASLLSNEETELFERIGITNIFYDPAILAEHLIPAERLTPEWFRKRVYWQAVSDMVAGNVSPYDKALREEYGRVVAALAPQYRNIDMFTFDPRDHAEFARQLKAIFLAAVMLGGGMRAAV